MRVYGFLRFEPSRSSLLIPERHQRIHAHGSSDGTQVATIAMPRKKSEGPAKEMASTVSRP